MHPPPAPRPFDPTPPPRSCAEIQATTPACPDLPLNILDLNGGEMSGNFDPPARHVARLRAALRTSLAWDELLALLIFVALGPGGAGFAGRGAYKTMIREAQVGDCDAKSALAMLAGGGGDVIEIDDDDSSSDNDGSYKFL